MMDPVDDMKQLAWSLGCDWPDDKDDQRRCLIAMAKMAVYWRQQVEHVQSTDYREGLYKHQAKRIGALTTKVKNLRKALRQYMAAQAAYVREVQAEITAAIANPHPLTKG
jgi:hypothetical protein